jgi:DNA-binding XRE family transcriptional regulator
MSSKNELPYKRLGLSLKQMRVRRQESLAEVSGAVEIESDFLSAIESGAERPSEDVLALLISHFSVRDEIARRLWELAGYDINSDAGTDDVDSTAQQNAVMIMPMDLRIVYTDMVHVVVNDYGLVMNFMQTGGAGNKPLAIARVGMSREHARSVLDVLQKTLAQSEPKHLPAPRQAEAEGTTEK